LEQRAVIKRVNKSYLYVLAGVLLSVLAYVYFERQFERVPRWIETGLRGEAARNPLLAAERLLSRLGGSAQNLRHLPLTSLPLGAHDSLLIWQEKNTLAPILNERLHAWVRAGGHLLVSAHTPLLDTTGESLLQSLGVALEFHPDSRREDKSIAWGEQILQVDFNPNYALHSVRVDAQTLVAAADGAHVLHFPLGQGRVTVFSDLLFLDNKHIGTYDHAQFLWEILHFSAPPGKMWLLLPNTQSPSLWALLWQNAWAFIVSLILIGVAALWTGALHFGPRLPPPAQARRRILEHLDASGRFFWQQQQHRYLYAAALRALHERLRVRRPDWLDLPSPQLHARLATLSALPLAQITDALPPPENSANTLSNSVFLRRIQTLEKIRKAL
jgi:hypothetical protein